MNTTKQPHPIREEQVRGQLQKILASPGFFRAARMQRFLTFVVESTLKRAHNPEELKESVIGFAVFDRDAGYDPKSDPVVRVEARRLRNKLEEYYSTFGKEEAIRIEIPKGSYVPVWGWQNGYAPLAEEAPPAKKRPWARSRVVLVSVLIAAAACVAAISWRRLAGERANASLASGKIRSLAVLPFRNLSGNPAQEYLVAGVTDEITTELARIGNLKVISRTSADQYRTTKKRLPEIARELGVDAVVEGTVLNSPPDVQVSAQLIRAATDSHLWADSYRRDGSDLFGLEKEIAGNIAREIGATLDPDSGRAVRGRPVNPAAYDCYLRGRYLWNKRTLDSLRKSIDYYQRAIKIDPNYARAYAALGDSYVLLGSYGGAWPGEPLEEARRAAEKALRLDGNLAEAHTVLAAVKVEWDWDWAGATKEYQTALRLDPNYPTAHHWYSIHLSRLGRHKEAEAEIQRALELDPLSLIIASDAGEAYYWAREPDQAMTRLTRVLELDPNFGEAHLILGKVFEQKKEPARALAEFKRANSIFKNVPNVTALEAHALALAGKRDQALKIARDLEVLSAQRYVSSVDIGLIYCALGDHDAGMNWLEKAYQRRGKGIDILGTDPLFDGCRPDPRFQELLKRLKLVQ